MLDEGGQSLVVDCTAKHFDHPISFIVAPDLGAVASVEFSNSPLAVKDPTSPENAWVPWAGNPIQGGVPKEIVRYAPIKAIRVTVVGGAAKVDQKG